MTTIRGRVLTILAGLALAMTSVVSPVSGQRARSDVDTTSITVGDRLGLTVQVTHDATASVQWPDSLDLSPFELVSVGVGAPTTQDEGTTSTARYTLTAFELGELEIPSFDIAVTAADGSTSAVSTDRFGVEVLSVGADEGGDIREIRGPLSIPVGVIRVLLWALGLVALSAAAYAMARRRAERGQEAATPDSGPPPRPPHELALAALERLGASPMLDRGQVKEYHVELSDILRRYVEARYQVPALEMTTREIEGGLRRVGVSGAFGDELRRILQQCDLAKFAKARPDAEVSREALALARDLVTSSAAPTGTPDDAGAAVTPPPGRSPGGTERVVTHDDAGTLEADAARLGEVGAQELAAGRDQPHPASAGPRGDGSDGAGSGEGRS